MAVFKKLIEEQNSDFGNLFRCLRNLPYSGKVWQIDSFRAFGERKFGELIDRPIGY